MIIAIAHQKGGTGKSTIAVNLTQILKAHVLDLDMQHSCILFNKIRVKNNYESFTCYEADNEDTLQSILRNYMKTDEILIIDLGGFDSVLNRLALINADLLITPVSPSQIELFGLQRFQNILVEASEIIGRVIKTNVLINNAEPRSKTSIIKLQRFIESNSTHFYLLNTIVHSRIDFKKSYERGISVIENDKDSKSAHEIINLSKEIRCLLK